MDAQRSTGTLRLRYLEVLYRFGLLLDDPRKEVEIDIGVHPARQSKELAAAVQQLKEKNFRLEDLGDPLSHLGGDFTGVAKRLGKQRLDPVAVLSDGKIHVIGDDKGAALARYRLREVLSLRPRK